MQLGSLVVPLIVLGSVGNFVAGEALSNEQLTEKVQRLEEDLDKLKGLPAQTEKLNNNVERIMQQLHMPQCPTGWVEFRSSCYGFGDNTASWGAAQESCSLFGASLAEVESTDENTFLYNMSRSRSYTSVWLGATDMFVEGQWVWSSSKKPLQAGFTHWDPTNPSDTGGEDCLEIRDADHWNDNDCNKPANFVCELRLSDQRPSLPADACSRILKLLGVVPDVAKPLSSNREADKMEANIRTIMQRLDRLDPQVTSCPDGWIHFKSSCYGVGSNEVTWGAAQEICGRFGGSLVEIDNSAENEFVKEIASSRGYSGIWMGATDVFWQGHWVWASSWRPVSEGFTYWYPGQETGNNGGPEDCLVMWTYPDNIDYMWHDANCNNNPFQFVCEIRL